MKRMILVLALLLLSVLASADQMWVSGTCEQCPKGADCTASESDGCNTSTYEAWCSGGHWYHSQMGVTTLLYCEKSVEFRPIRVIPEVGG